MMMYMCCHEHFMFYCYLHEHYVCVHACVVPKMFSEHVYSCVVHDHVDLDLHFTQSCVCVCKVLFNHDLYSQTL